MGCLSVLYFFIVFLLFIFLILFMLKPGALSAEQRKKFAGRSYAHRGLYSQDQLIPENSLPAFTLARDNGYGMEFDIRLTKDKEVVVFHDQTLSRMCGIKQDVSEFTLEQLQKTHLKNTQYTLPSLIQVLQAIDGKVPLIIELKSEQDYNELCSKTLDILQTYSGDFCVESFDPRIVRWFKVNAKNIVRGQLANPMSHYPNTSVIKKFFLSNVLFNFLTRPNFIAYDTEKNSVFVLISECLGAMKVVWTVKKHHDIRFFERTNDCIIFEHFLPNERFI